MGDLISREALFEILKKYKFGAIINESAREYTRETVLNFVKEQPTIKAEPQWIPCSERLPKVEDLHDVNLLDCTQYLIQRRCGVMDVAHYIRVYGDSYFEANTMVIKDVIAWMPLPEPYKAERT